MLSFMAMDYFQKSPLLSYPLFALAAFMLVFFAITVRTVLTQKHRYDGLASMPLGEDSIPETLKSTESGRERK